MNLKRLQELTALAAPSGYEDPVMRVMRREMGRMAGDVRVDRLGNVIARLPGPAGGGKPIMVFAHMDELGFVVRKIEPDGFLRVERLGGIPERIAPGRAVHIVTPGGNVLGVVGMRSHHYTRPEEKNVVVPVQDLYVDVGASSADQVAAMGVAVGNPICYAPFFHVQGDRVMAKTLDNRAGCEVLLETLERVAGLARLRDLVFVGTVQEEFSLRGVLPTFPVIQPEVAVALDVAVACDTPDLRSVSDTRLGGGPVVSLYTFHGRGTLGGLIPNPKLVAAVLVTFLVSFLVSSLRCATRN